MLSSKADYGQTKTYFKKLREVFVQHGMKKKKIFHIFQRCHQLGESKLSFSLIFLDFWFFLLQSRFCGSCFGEVEMKFEKLKEVFSPEIPYTINSFIFFTGVTDWEKPMTERTPIFSSFDQICSSRFFGIYLLFSARRIEFDLLSLRIVMFI
jgi:hypothetical protein